MKNNIDGLNDHLEERISGRNYLFLSIDEMLANIFTVLDALALCDAGAKGRSNSGAGRRRLREAA